MGDQFGSGKSRKISAKKIAKAKSGAGSHRRKCCSYAEAGKAITRLEFRLAVRYVRMDVKARMGFI